MSWSRRRVLGAAGLLAAASAAAILERAEAEDGEGSRRIMLKNLHTPESLDIVYRRGGDYVPQSMTAIQKLLRDYRTGAEHSIDPKLLDILCDVAKLMSADASFVVISGYRSPGTNEMLHERSSGVSSHSLHMEGRAMDVRLAGVDCADLAERAIAMRRGGVGYYKKSNFVHLDTGRVRTWRG